jgi:RimJ/RimL family protein N-acetyltransferase
MIRLEKFDQTCYDTLISWVDSAEALMQFAGPAFTFPLTREQLDKSMSDPNRFAFSVVDRNSGKMIGHAEIYLTKESAYLGRIIIGDPQIRGKGLGGQIVSSLLDYVFDVLEQNKVQLNVFDWNLGAIKCYEKLGFRINPDKKVERVVSGQTWIALNMTIDKQKWKRLQRALKSS